MVPLIPVSFPPDSPKYGHFLKHSSDDAVLLFKNWLPTHFQSSVSGVNVRIEEPPTILSQEMRFLTCILVKTLPSQTVKTFKNCSTIFPSHTRKTVHSFDYLFFFCLNFYSATLKRDLQASDTPHPAKCMSSFTCCFPFLHFLSVEPSWEEEDHCISGIWCPHLQRQAMEEYGSQSKPSCDFSCNHKGFAWQASWEKAALLAQT